VEVIILLYRARTEYIQLLVCHALFITLNPARPIGPTAPLLHPVFYQHRNLVIVKICLMTSLSDMTLLYDIIIISSIRRHHDNAHLSTTDIHTAQPTSYTSRLRSAYDSA